MSRASPKTYPTPAKDSRPGSGAATPVRTEALGERPPHLKVVVTVWLFGQQAVHLFDLGLQRLDINGRHVPDSCPDVCIDAATEPPIATEERCNKCDGGSVKRMWSVALVEGPAAADDRLCRDMNGAAPTPRGRMDGRRPSGPHSAVLDGLIRGWVRSTCPLAARLITGLATCQLLQ